MSSDATSNEKAGGEKKRRWLWPLLVVSVGLNLLFVGLVAGRVWLHEGGKERRHRIFTGAVEKLMQDLPEAKRQNAGALLERHRTTVRQIRKQIRKQRRVTKEAVLTEPYDELKVSQALARFRVLRTEQHQSMHAMMLDLLKGLNLKEREVLLKHIRASFRGRWRRKRSSERQ